MDETMNVQTATDIPENTLANKPQTNLKKKFCLATIPAIMAMLTTFFISAYNIIGMLSFAMNYEGKWIFAEQVIVYAIQFITIFLLCVLMFAKLNKAFLCVPTLGIGLTYVAHLVFSLLNVYDQNEFEKAMHYDRWFFTERSSYTYSDYMTIRVTYWVFLAIMILSFVVASVYIILASSEKLNKKVRGLWALPTVVSVLSIVMYIVYTVVEILLYSIKYEFGNIFSTLIGSLMNLIIFVPEILMIIFLCKWISNPYKKVKKKTPKVPAPAPVVYVPVPQPVQVMPDPAQNDIELIKQYKELLDTGAITQEEYEEKKAELLNKK